MTDATLAIDGVDYSGWTAIRVSRQMECLATSFDISFSELWAGSEQPMPIIEGIACTLKLGTEDVVVGYVDESSINYDANQHSMSVTGRSRTGDLVDCGAIYALGKGQWRNQTLATIADDLCSPFGIGVVVNHITTGGALEAPFRRFALQDSETVHEALERACRMRGVLMMTDGSGQLVFTRSGSTRTRTVIQRGVNVLTGARMGSWKERFSQYIVKCQIAGDDFINAEGATTIKTSLDEEVDRYRPLIVQAEGQETGTQLQKRADWERNIRAGRSQRLSYTVQGWENDEGLWEPNVLVQVKDPWLRVDAELIIVSACQTKSEQGTTTELELCDPKALTVEPIVPKPDRTRDWLI